MAETETEQTLKPNVTVEDIGPARKCLTIEVPSEQIADKIEQSYDQLNTDAAIPGFRKGRAPRKLIERRFSSAVHDDVRAQIISEAYSVAIEGQELDVLGEPEIKDHDDIEMPDDGPLTFKVEVEITPEVELPDFEKIEVEKQVKPVTDADVDEEVVKLCERHGNITAVEGEKIKEKDYVQGDVHIYKGQDAGDDADVLAHHHDTYVLVNGEELDYRGHIAGIVVDDLGKTLTGNKVGDAVAVSTTGPANHENEDIRDQPITIKLDIKKVERVEPAKADALPQMMGFEDVAGLKDQIRQSLEDRRQREQQAALHEQVSKHLEDSVKLELPEKLTGRQAARVLQRQAMELAYQGATEQEIEQQIAEARASSEEEAKRQLKLFFILDKAAKELDVEVSEGEINGRISMLAMQQGRRPEKMRQQMQRDGEIEHLYLSIREQKALDQIVSKAKVKEIAEPTPAKPAAAEKKTTKKKSTKKKSSKKKTAKKKTGDGDSG